MKEIFQISSESRDTPTGVPMGTIPHSASEELCRKMSVMRIKSVLS